MGGERWSSVWGEYGGEGGGGRGEGERGRGGERGESVGFVVGPTRGPVVFGIDATEEIDLFEKSITLDLFGSCEGGRSGFGAKVRFGVVEGVGQHGISDAVVWIEGVKEILDAERDIGAGCAFERACALNDRVFDGERTVDF